MDREASSEDALESDEGLDEETLAALLGPYWALRDATQAAVDVIAKRRARDLSCAKGCAHPKATRTVTATKDGFALVHNGKAGDTPDLRITSPQDIIKAL